MRRCVNRKGSFDTELDYLDRKDALAYDAEADKQSKAEMAKFFSALFTK